MIKKIFFLLMLLNASSQIIYGDNSAKDIPFDTYLRGFDYKERKNMKIDIPEALDLFAKGEAEIIDIRFREEQQAYSFPFIKMIPINELSDRLGELDKNKIIITVCPHYDRAEIARLYLTLKGYRSKYLTDGLTGLAEHLRGDIARDFMKRIKEKNGSKKKE